MTNATLPAAMNLLTVSLHGLALASLGMGSLLLLALALRHTTASRSAAAWGAGCFVLFALVLKPLFQQFIGLDFNWHWAAFALTAALLAGIFEESGRALALRHLGPGNPPAQGWVWLFGLGYALCELWLAGLAAHVQLLLLARQPEELERVRSALPPAAYQQLARGIAALDAWSALWLAVERSSAVVLQLALTAGVWIALARRSWRLLVIIVLAHAAADLPAALYQAGLWPLWLVELVVALAAMLALPWVLHRLVPPRLRHVFHLTVK